MARAEVGEGFLTLPLGLVVLNDALHGVGDFFRRHALDAAIEAGLAAESAAEKYVEMLDELAVNFLGAALQADVGDPVLAARVGAAVDVDAKKLRLAPVHFLIQ